MENIRPYEKSDAKEVSKLFDNFQDYLKSLDNVDIVRRGPGYGMKYLKMTLKSISKRSGTLHVAISDGRIVGLIVTIILPKYKDPGIKRVKSGRITELYLEKSHRGKGIGLQLMEVAEKHLKKKNCKRIFITVFVPNKQAHGFYRKLGYKDCDIDLIKYL